MCLVCALYKPACEFPERSIRCKECHRSYTRQHYRDNKEYYKRKARNRQIRVNQETRRWLLAFLSKHPCVDCGETEIRALEFDHRIPGEKTMPVSLLATSGYPLTRVQTEVDKCEVRCANCHRIRTHKQLGWWGSRRRG